MENNTPPRPKPSRRFKIILGLSLALNLAVAGMIAGAALRHDGDGRRGGLRSTGLGAYGLPYMMALPKEERRRVVSAIKSDLNGGVPDREARRALYAEVLSALRAVPFDAENLAASVSDQANTTIRVQQSAQSAWMDVIAQMNDAERAAYADEVEKVLRRGPPRRQPE